MMSGLTAMAWFLAWSKSNPATAPASKARRRQSERETNFRA
jgi:hypothetical protein